MTIEQYKQQILALSHQACDASHRRLVVLSGDRQEVIALSLLAIAEVNPHKILWCSESAPEAATRAGLNVLTLKTAMKQLGSECDMIVLDAFSGLHPDGFGAVSGTLKAGGLLVLLAPPMGEWVKFDDPDYERITSLPYQRGLLHRYFIRRIKNIICASPQVLLVERADCGSLTVPQLFQKTQVSDAEGPASLRIQRVGESGSALLSGSESMPGSEASPDGCLTEDQQAGVDAVCNVVLGHRRRPLVLTSDRGRGKSATLGLAAAKLLKQKPRHIIITAPYPAAVESAFARLEASFENGERHGQAFFCAPDASVSGSGQGCVEFIAPDELIESSPDADLVLVDEAAAIPVPMLTSLLLRYSRIVFSSTIHGYEGTGRGFAVRFTKVLDQEAPQWRALHLKSPIRWADNDPLEDFMFDALLLNAACAEASPTESPDLALVETKWLDRAALADDREQLNEVFGLLVLAHYRTSPDDLRMMLDGPSLRIAALYYESRLLAVALVCREGGLDNALGELIWQGRRRPRGHLIPQSLSTFGGDKQATELIGDRIMRIAVHPDLQRSGFGGRLIESIVERGRQDAVDYVGASFGVTADLLAFWMSYEFTPVRMGLHKEASSGTHSAILMRSLSERGRELCKRSHQRFIDQFVFDLGDTFSQLDTAVVVRIMSTSNTLGITMSDQDWSDLVAFSKHHRVYETCSISIWKMLVIAMQKGRLSASLNEQNGDTEILVRRTVQKWSPGEVISKYNLTGKKELNQVLMRAASLLLADDDYQAFLT